MQDYTVDVARTSDGIADASVRSFHLTLGARRGALSLGFNPVETLLSALGSCLMTSLAMVSELSRVPITTMHMHLRGTRQDKPPVLVAVGYHLTVVTDLGRERVDRLIELAHKNSTVFQTLSGAVPISGTWDYGSLGS
ncbi:osmotically inducible protein C [Sulfobacillus sp. hq2]|nr:osmotically inducible protein C [Sulfobacillus sp. hq2]